MMDNAARIKAAANDAHMVFVALVMSSQIAFTFHGITNALYFLSFLAVLFTPNRVHFG
ncbi:MAG: hypothetical protein ACK5KM_12770 [Hyphomicrobiaceae bacterium]